MYNDHYDLESAMYTEVQYIKTMLTKAQDLMRYTHNAVVLHATLMAASEHMKSLTNRIEDNTQLLPPLDNRRCYDE